MGIIPSIGVLSKPGTPSFVLPSISSAFSAPATGYYNLIQITVTLSGGNCPSIESGICWNYTNFAIVPPSVPPTIADSKNIVATSSNQTYQTFLVMADSWFRVRAYVKYLNQVAYANDFYASYRSYYLGTPPEVQDDSVTVTIYDQWNITADLWFYGNGQGNNVEAWRVELIYMQWGWNEYLYSYQEFSGNDQWFNWMPYVGYSDTYFFRFYFKLNGQWFIFTKDGNQFVTL